MAKKDLTKELIELISSGNYDIIQQFKGKDIEPYEGCTHNLFMWLESGEAKIRLLDATDPRAHKNSKTYTMEMSTYMGDATLTIWEV